MSTTNRRSAGTGSTATGDGDSGSSSVGVSVAGVDNSDLEKNPQKYQGEVIKGAHFRSVDVPEHAPSGGTMNVGGVVRFDQVAKLISDAEIRVRLDSPSLSEPIFQSVGKLSHGQTRTFSIEVPVPVEGGEQMAVRLTGQRKSAFGTGWAKGKVSGPHRVDVISQDEAQARDTFGRLSKAAIGAAAGVAVSQIAGGDTVPYGVGGASVALAVEYMGGFDTVVPDIGNVAPDPQTIALAGVGLGGAAFFLQSSGAAGVLGSAGDAAGSAIDVGRRAAESAAPPRLQGSN